MKPKGWATAGLAVLSLTIAGWRLAAHRSTPHNGTNTSGPAKESIRSTSHRDDERTRRTKTDREAINAAAQRWHEKLLERFPQFQVEFKDVPDDENGFLQFLILSDEFGGDGATLGLPDELREMLAGDAPWNPELLEKWLSENDALFSRLLAIAEASDQSVKGIAPKRLLAPNAKLAVEIGRLLVAVGRLHSEDGPPDQALRFHQAVMNFAGHFERVELPTLLTKTIAILLQQSAFTDFRQNLLPHLTDDPTALQTWRESLRTSHSLNIDGPKVLIGEWNVTTAGALLPQLLDGSINHPDPDALLEAFAVGFSEGVEKVRTIEASEVYQDRFLTFDSPPGLSGISREMVGSHGAAHSAWLRGYVREISVSAMNDATFAVLLGEPLPVEPVTGKPFRWNPVLRTISAPPETADFGPYLPPIKLP